MEQELLAITQHLPSFPVLVEFVLLDLQLYFLHPSVCHFVLFQLVVLSILVRLTVSGLGVYLIVKKNMDDGHQWMDANCTPGSSVQMMKSFHNLAKCLYQKFCILLENVDDFVFFKDTPQLSQSTVPRLSIFFSNVNVPILCLLGLLNVAKCLLSLFLFSIGD